MPESPTKLNRSGSLSPLMAEVPSRQSSYQLMNLSPMFNLSKLSTHIAKTQSASPQKDRQQSEEILEEQKPQPVNSSLPQYQTLESFKATNAPSQSLLCMSPTMPMDAESPICIEPTSALKLVQGKDIIGDYKIGKLLGQGAYGEVKLGEHIQTGNKVAIKIMEKAKQKTERALMRIDNEISILRQSEHPNVMACYDVIETEKAWFLLTEFCSNGELFDYVSDKESLEEREAKEILEQILDGLSYLHEDQICHRDIKLENMLIDHQNRIKIADFGMATMFKEGEKLETRCGSAHYMCPEIVKGEPYDPTAYDIWSLGVLFYSMVHGFMPFEGDTDKQILRNVRKAAFLIDDNLSYDCQDLIRQMMDSNPETRITIDAIRDHPFITGPKKEIAICIEEL